MGWGRKNLVNLTIKMEKPLINILTRFSRENSIRRSLDSINSQTYNNIKHYITYETTEGLSFLESLEYKHPTEFVRVPNYGKIDNLHLYYEHHDLHTDYLNWDWEKWDVQAVLGDEIPQRKEIPCEKTRYSSEGYFCETLSHSLRRVSHHAPYNLYLKIAEERVNEGWIAYLDDDDIYTSDEAIQILADEISHDEDTLHVYRLIRVNEFGDNFIPSNRYWPYLKAGHPFIVGEIGGACICFHSKYKGYTQWGHWTADDYRTVSVLGKVIPRKNFINKVLYDSFKAGAGKVD